MNNPQAGHCVRTKQLWEQRLNSLNLSQTALEWAEFLSGEVLVFGLLGRILYQPPQSEWLKSLAEDQVFDEIPLGADLPETKEGMALLGQWSRAYLKDQSGDLQSALDGDYNRLFVGPGKVLAPPWESVYATTDRLIFQEQTIQVRNWYRRFGLEAEKLYHEPDDHIGLELSFLAHLASLSLQALESQDEPEFLRLINAQRDFLKEHLLQWCFDWIRDVQEFAKLEFYTGIALLVKGTVNAARTTFEERFGAL